MTTEDLRRKAITELMSWQHQDETVKIMVRTVLIGHEQPSIGHLARLCPEEFDILYEEASGMVRNDV